MIIHAAVHAATNYKAVLHTHMPYATVLTCLRHGRVEFVHQNSIRFFNRIAYDEEYNGLALAETEGKRIAAKFAESPSCSILFLGNHGVIVCGNSMAEAFDDLYYLEQACRIQVLAMSTNRAMRYIDEKVVKETAAQMMVENPPQAKLHLAALIRILDDESPGWKEGKLGNARL